MRRAILAALLFFALTMSCAKRSAAYELPIQPVYQQTQVWCWAAVAEMVLRYYDWQSINPAGNYQCGIVALLNPICNQNCFACITPIGSTFQLAQVMHYYQQVANQIAYPGDFVEVQPEPRLSLDDLVGEIDSDAPVLIGISPSGMASFYPPGMSDHVALVVGYDEQTGALLVNDPYPYNGIAFNPYMQVGGQQTKLGQYWISYPALVQGLGYKDTLTLR